MSESGKDRETTAAQALLDGLIDATAFLSRLPVWRLKRDPHTLPDFARSAPLFPLAGLAIGLIPAFLLLVFAATNLPAALVALVTIGSLIVITGALHEDGLADVADGFFGGATLEKRLAIMRDSTIGTYGALALMLSVALRVGCLAALLLVLEPLNTACIVLAIAAISRAATLYPWALLPAARPSDGPETANRMKNQAGLSARYGVPTRSDLHRAMLCSLPAVLLLLIATSLIATLFALVLAAVGTLGATSLARRHIGGHTGDVLGATQQSAELALYFALAALM